MMEGISVFLLKYFQKYGIKFGYPSIMKKRKKGQKYGFGGWNLQQSVR